MPAVGIENHILEMHAQNELRLIGLINAESKAHADTLAVLRALKEGELQLSQVVVTDDGWRIIPTPPSTNGTKEKAKA